MTKPEFIRGYLLLTSQPWGKSYRTTAVFADGEPSPAEIQLQFYYDQLSAHQFPAWIKTCEELAKGEHWPSIDAIKTAFKAYTVAPPALPAPATEHFATKEEFGVNLYETIKTIGGIMGIDAQRAQAIHMGEGYKVQDLLTRRTALQTTLAEQLPRLANHEIDQVLARYPWVTGC